MDNASKIIDLTEAKTNKNRYLVSFGQEIINALGFYEIELAFLVAGHTKVIVKTQIEINSFLLTVSLAILQQSSPTVMCLPYKTCLI